MKLITQTYAVWYFPPYLQTLDRLLLRDPHSYACYIVELHLISLIDWSI